MLVKMHEISCDNDNCGVLDNFPISVPISDSITKIKKSDICLSMKRKAFTTTIKEDSLKEVKKLAIDLDRSVNDLLEEAIEWLLKKYEKKRKE